MSTLVVSNINDGTTTVPATYVTNGSAKAWVNFDGTGTIAVRDSKNVSSLTDNTTGDYYVNFSSSMGNQNYCTLDGTNRETDAFTSNVYTNNATGLYEAPATNRFRISTNAGLGSGGRDSKSVNCAVFGDLA